MYPTDGHDPFAAPPEPPTNDDAPATATDTPDGLNKFRFKRSGTTVSVTRVNDDGTVDIQEPEAGSKQRFWPSVNVDDLEAV